MIFRFLLILKTKAEVVHRGNFRFSKFQEENFHTYSYDYCPEQNGYPSPSCGANNDLLGSLRHNCHSFLATRPKPRSLCMTCYRLVPGLEQPAYLCRFQSQASMPRGSSFANDTLSFIRVHHSTDQVKTSFLREGNLYFSAGRHLYIVFM